MSGLNHSESGVHAKMPKKVQILIIKGVLTVGAATSIAILGNKGLYVLPFAVIGGPLLNYFYERRRATLALLMEVHEKLQVPSDASLRCAVLRPCWRRRALKVYARYPNPKARRPKTRMLISQGVAGRCYRTKDLCNVPIMKGVFETQHVRDLGFMAEDAARFKQDRESYLCVPILNPSKDVIAILSFDSSQEDIFSKDRIGHIYEYVPKFRENLAF